jgi:molybdopterin synthase catalytic subunit
MAHSFLTVDPLDMNALLDLVRAPRYGGYVTFAGDVRDHDHGAVVTEIDYVAYDELARKELLLIVQTAEKRWPDCTCAAAHRTGVLRVGETSVAIAVAAPHRAEAFEACRWIIDTLKTDLPIWKREEFATGGRVWIEGHQRVAAGSEQAAPEERPEAMQP